MEFAGDSLDPQISIHALREERDLTFKFDCVTIALISIHALREERDQPAWRRLAA